MSGGGGGGGGLKTKIPCAQWEGEARGGKEGQVSFPTFDADSKSAKNQNSLCLVGSMTMWHLVGISGELKKIYNNFFHSHRSTASQIVSCGYETSKFCHFWTQEQKLESRLNPFQIW